METDKNIDFPALPEVYFWRVERVYHGTISLQLRKKFTAKKKNWLCITKPKLVSEVVASQSLKAYGLTKEDLVSSANYILDHITDIYLYSNSTDLDALLGDYPPKSLEDKTTVEEFLDADYRV